MATKSVGVWTGMDRKLKEQLNVVSKVLVFLNKNSYCLKMMNCGQLGLACTTVVYHNCSSFFDEWELFCTRTN